jgi:D-lactate dehydrogenase (cytochrome)
MVGGNTIRAENMSKCPISRVRQIADPLTIESDYRGYILDESRMMGDARYLFFPRSEDEVASILGFLDSEGESVHVSGARTGIAGSSVPLGGGIISTDMMNRIHGLGWDKAEGRYFVRCGPAVSLHQLEGALVSKAIQNLDMSREEWEDFNDGEYRYPVDPTERGASLGGTIATNASGARTFRYGPSRDWVRRLRVMLPSGHVLDITRGKTFEEEGRFIISIPDEEEIVVPVPHYDVYPEEGVKNAAGIFSEGGMDLIDLFIGSEGLLGIITLAEVWIETARPQFSVVLFLGDLERALDLVELLRSDQRLAPEFIELMDKGCLSLLREVQEDEPVALGVPPLPADAGSAVMFDLPLAEDMRPSLSIVSEMAQRCQTDLERSWCGYERRELERFVRFRHSAPETVNGIIAARKREHPEIHKLGTDIAVPDDRMREMISFYRERLGSSGLEYVMFGHIGDNHPHVNILPRDLLELERGKELYIEFARKGVSLGGSVSAEHGIGKLKKDFLGIMYGEEGLEQMRLVKRALDPRGILNPGNMFDLEVTG